MDQSKMTPAPRFMSHSVQSKHPLTILPPVFASYFLMQFLSTVFYNLNAVFGQYPAKEH